MTRVAVISSDNNLRFSDKEPRLQRGDDATCGRFNILKQMSQKSGPEANSDTPAGFMCPDTLHKTPLFKDLPAVDG